MTRTTMIGEGPEWQDGVPGVRLLIIGKDSYETYDLPSVGTVRIGRSEASDVRLNDPQASRAHARLLVGDGLLLEDLGSVNGTRVRDRPVGRGERVAIESGDTIVIGSSVLIVHVRSQVPPTAAFAESPTFSDASLGVSPGMGIDRAMQSLHRLAERAAVGTINILILGETGVGKEVMASAIHRLSLRHAGPYICLNCAALSEGLLESELFGHEKGAFTGAAAAKVGLLETAEGGTLFLDEVGELPRSTQAKLLRTLETKEVTRLGSVRPKRLDVRFIAATNRNLPGAIAAGSFREDLFFRLNGVSLQIPPLRERRGEILPLAEGFVRDICRDLKRPEPRLSPMVTIWLERQAWPGNIRELKNVIERAVLLCVGGEIGLEHLPEDRPVRSHEPPLRPTADLTDRAQLATAASASAREPTEERDDAPPPNGGIRRLPTNRLAPTADSDKQKILDALASCAGNQSRAAKLLGMPRRTFVARLDRYDIPRPKKNREDEAD
jgi:two-component system, NtrC family, response regulator AtoC